MWWKILTGLLIGTVVVLVFLMPPPQKELGDISRIFFFHVPVAWVTVLAFLVAMVNSILYLSRKDPVYDLQAAISSQLGFLFAILATVSGAIFAKNAWGSYWNWDPRETSVFILLLIYGAYLALRSAIEAEDRKANLSAVYSILAFITVPFLVFVVPRVFQSLHPTDSIVNSQIKIQMPPLVLLVFLSSLLGFSLLFVWIYNLEVKLNILYKKAKEIHSVG
ncbi:MAG: cytochrome c biogenesis protein [candidate division Zixibacteria bacterium]|nr:cytochrome c biogenesis protein [candidate division Zixibacteria bacterium]